MSARSDAFRRVGALLDEVVETLQRAGIEHDVDVSVWYSSNDGTWKHSILQRAPESSPPKRPRR